MGYVVNSLKFFTMARTNEQEQKAKVKVENPGTDHEMNRAQKTGARAPMYKGPQATPGNKRVGVKRRY